MEDVNCFRSAVHGITRAATYVVTVEAWADDSRMNNYWQHNGEPPLSAFACDRCVQLSHGEAAWLTLRQVGGYGRGRYVCGRLWLLQLRPYYDGFGNLHRYVTVVW